MLKQGKYLGYEWQIHLNDLGCKCGYIIIDKRHPWYGKHYTDLNLDIHGGITYSKPENNNWRLGFDCGHCFDLPDPGYEQAYHKLLKEAGATNKSIEYVEEQCKSLCEQAWAYEKVIFDYKFKAVFVLLNITLLFVHGLWWQKLIAIIVFTTLYYLADHFDKRKKEAILI